jgi:Spy/CpxP family protein refolding chaperone
MKKILVTMIAAALSLSAVAQQNNASKKNNGKHKGDEMGKHNGDEMRRSGPQQVRRQGTIGALSSVNLTDAQKQQLQQLNDTYKQQMQELNKNETITVKEQKERREALTQQHKTNVQNILTPEQRSQIKQQRKEHKGKDHKKAKDGDMMGKGGDRSDDLRQLNLTDDQGARIKAVNEEFRTKVQAIQKNTALTNDQKKTQRDEAQQQHTAAIKAILTQEQKDKLAALKSTRPDKKGRK